MSPIRPRPEAPARRGRATGSAGGARSAPGTARVARADAAHASIRLRASVSNLTRRLRALAAPDGPGAAKLGVLGQLYRLGTLTPTQLAGHERVRLQTLTRLIAELEGAGLVARESHPFDARQSLLSLTTAGVRMLSADVHRREASLAKALATTLSPAECATVVEACALIDRLAAAIGDATATAVGASGAPTARRTTRRPSTGPVGR